MYSYMYFLFPPSRYHNNVELRQSVKYMKRYVGDDHTFIINRVKVSDRGEFIIRAENHYGVTEEIVFLNVQPAPRDVTRYTPGKKKSRNGGVRKK